MTRRQRHLTGFALLAAGVGLGLAIVWAAAWYAHTCPVWAQVPVWFTAIVALGGACYVGAAGISHLEDF